MFFFKKLRPIKSLREIIRGRRMKSQGWKNYCEHGVPTDRAFESYGAIFRGGICSTCGKLNQGKFLGNVSGMCEIIDGKSVPCEGKPISYFQELGWKISRVPP